MKRQLIFEFDSDENESFEIQVKATENWMLLNEIREKLRGKIKYCELSEETREILEEIYSEVCHIC